MLRRFVDSETAPSYHRAGIKEMRPMPFELSEDQRLIQKTARDFAASQLAPYAAKWDEEEIFPVPTMREAAALGFAGIYVKGDVGGSELTRLDAALIFEELSAGC